MLVVVPRLLISVASLVLEHGVQAQRISVVAAMVSVVTAHGLQSAGLIIVAHRLSCSKACGIFLDQGSNPALASGFFTTEPPGKPLKQL